MDHECARQTDERTDILKRYSADGSISIKSKAYTDFQTLNAPTQIRLISESRNGSMSRSMAQMCLSIMRSFSVTSANIAINDMSLKTSTYQDSVSIG